MRDSLIIFCVLLALFLGLENAIHLEALIYVPAIQQVGIPILIFSLSSRFITNVKLSKLWYWMGIPLGVSSSAICLLDLLSNLETSAGFEKAIGVSLISLGYGLTVSMLGHAFCVRDSEQETAFNTLPSIGLKVGIVFTALTCLMVSIESQIGLIYVADFSGVLLVISTVLLGVFSSGKKKQADGIMRGFVFGALACVFVGLISYLFSGLDPKGFGPATATALSGLIYAGFGMVITIACLNFNELIQADIPRLNWHLLEVYALWVLMIFAPMSLRESFALLPTFS